MRPTAIDETFKAGHTRQHAHLLGERIGLTVYAPDEAVAQE